MKKYLKIGLLIALPAIWTGMLRADDRHVWRSWGVRSGFTETYSVSVSKTPGGNTYIRHGAVLTMSEFDGYGVTRLPDPRGNLQPDWPSTKAVYAASDGGLWTTSLDTLREYQNGKWVVRY